MFAILSHSLDSSPCSYMAILVDVFAEPLVCLQFTILLQWNGGDSHWPILGSLMFRHLKLGLGPYGSKLEVNVMELDGGIQESGLESCNWIQNGFPGLIQFITRLLITKGKSEREWNAPLREVVFKDKMKDVLNNCGSEKLNVIKKMELICSDPISIPAWNKK